MPKYKKKLTPKEKLLADNYLETMDQGKAALAAKYNGPIANARVWACRALAKPHVKEYVDEVMESAAMRAREVIFRTSEIAAGDIGNYIHDDGTIDIAKAKKERRTGIIKKLKVKEGPLGVETEIELYSSADALDKLARMYGLDKQKVEHSGPDGESLVFKVEYADTNDQPT